MAVPAPRPAARPAAQTPSDGGRTAVVAWVVVLGAAGLTAVLIVADVVRRTPHWSVWPSLAEDSTLWLIAGAVGGVALFVYGFKIRATQRVIENTPTLTVRSLPLGFVEVAGTAQPDGDPLSSPVSNQPCVFYTYRIQELRGGGRSRRWVTIAEERSTEPFYLRDRTGSVLIVPMGPRRPCPKSRSSPTAGRARYPITWPEPSAGSGRRPRAGWGRGRSAAARR